MAERRPIAPEAPVRVLPGVGPVTAARMAESGIRTVRDLLFWFPRRYEDYRRVYPIDELSALPAGSTVVVRGTVARVHKFFRRMLDVIIEDGGCRLRARWFRPNAGMAAAYRRGETVALAGRLHVGDTGPELLHPSNVTGKEHQVSIRPRYPLIAGVPGRTVEKAVQAAVAASASAIPELLPAALRARQELPSIAESLAYVHCPSPSLSEPAFSALLAGQSPAQRRLAFEELFVMQVGLALERRQTRRQHAFVCGGNREGALATIKSALPFPFTPSQEQAVGQLFDAFERAEPVQFLLQGDVGSGKTAVAFAAAARVGLCGGQTLLMAPTAVLAEQHFRTLRAFCGRAGLSVGLLHSGLPASEQREALAKAESGATDLLIGTQALIEDRLRLCRLGLAIVDEQHRFGVRQRVRLRRMDQDRNDWKMDEQGGMVPHLLVLSATPIPRTLALTLYGDLDLLTLRDVPPGRKPVWTGVCAGDEERKQAYVAVRQAAAEGAQAFVVCPAIDDDEADREAPRSAVALARELRAELTGLRIGVLHGRLAPDKQSAVVAKLRKGTVDVLVATSILEVGVDVPAASVMVVEDADRFGLAQLHQLRGRVGRGGQQGRCYLLTRSTAPEAIARLAFLSGTTDGFRIAEEDLRRRGAGDMHGTRQTGVFVDLAVHAEHLELARREAEAVLASDPELDMACHQALARAVWDRLTRARPVAEEAG